MEVDHAAADYPALIKPAGETRRVSFFYYFYLFYGGTEALLFSHKIGMLANDAANFQFVLRLWMYYQQ